MSVHKEGESYSYWPGYVDALTNIVLNLLFLVAIFVIGVAALGLVASKRKEVPEGAIVSSAPQTVIEHIQNVVRKIVVSSPEKSSAESEVNQKNKSNVIVQKIDVQTDMTVIRLAFESDSYLINKEEEVMVLRQLSDVLQVVGKRIVIWTSSQPDDALLIRGGMTRLLSVRNMLLRYGIAGGAIEVRMVPQIATKKNLNQVFIEIKKEDDRVENK